MIDRRLSLGVLLALLAVLPACTSLLRATRDRDHEGVARLLRAGKDPNEKESRPNDKNDKKVEGPTSLFEAIAMHDLELVKILVEGGANVNLDSNCEQNIVTPLHKAALHGDVAIVRYLLSKGADPKGLAEGDNVLEWLSLRPAAASPAEKKAIVRAVLQQIETKLGAEKVPEFLDGQTPSGWTPLALATFRNDVQLAKVLLERGASVAALAKAKPADKDNGDEWPPIHFAVILERPEIASLLIKAGATRGQKSRNGKTVANVLSDMEEKRERDAEETQKMAQLARENAREDERQRAANFQAFQSGLAKGLEKDPANPVNDTRFEERMLALSASEGDRKAAQEERDRATRAEEAAAARSRRSGDHETPRGGAAVPGGGDRKNGEDDARKEEARKQELARKEGERQQDETRRKEEARKKEEARLQEAASRKTEADERARAAKEAAKRDWQDFYAAMRSGIRLEATRSFCTGGYCARGDRPSFPGHGSSCIDVAFRATCVGTLNWSSGTLYNFQGVAADTAPITPTPSCKVKDVRFEVTDVREGCP